MLIRLTGRFLTFYKPSAASAPGTPERARATDGGRRGRTAAGGSPPPPEPKPQAHKIASARGPTRKSVRRTSGLKQRIHPSRSSPRRRHSSPEPRGPCSGRCRSCRWCRAGRAPTRTAAGPRRSLRPAARRRPPRSSASDVSAGSPGRWVIACVRACVCARVHACALGGRALVVASVGLGADDKRRVLRVGLSLYFCARARKFERLRVCGVPRANVPMR